MVKLEDVREALADVGVDGVEPLKNDKLLGSKFCYDLQMDSLDFEDFLVKIERMANMYIPQSAKDIELSVGEFIKICNANE